MSFPRSKVQHSAFVPFFLCALVGMLAAIMGVGGGFIMVPMMVYLLRMPPHVAVGTDLFQILFTCAGVTYMQATTNHTVDLVLALLLAAGSTIGAQIGARASRYLRGDQLLIILASLALLVVGKMLIGLLLTPTSVLDPAKAHAYLMNPGGGQTMLQARSPWRRHACVPPRHSCRGCLSGLPPNAERSLGAADTSVRATSLRPMGTCPTRRLTRV